VQATLQIITVPDPALEVYKRAAIDFHQKYIFPGGIAPKVPRV